MKNEIEYKFLVNKKNLIDLSNFGKAEIVQGYLSFDPAIRIRINTNYNAPFYNQYGTYGFLVIKSDGIVSRREFEKEIDLEEAKELLNMHKANIVSKTRYFVPTDVGLFWEIDIFDNTNLIIAEIEVPYEGYKLIKPNWIGDDITPDKRYGNAYIAQHGFPKEEEK